MDYININYPIASTVEIMKWIRENNCPKLNAQFFSFNGRTDYWNTFIVSNSEPEYIKSILTLYPLDSWFDYEGMKRICIGNCLWVIYINGNFYYITD